MLGWSVPPAYLTARRRDTGELVEIPAPVVRPENTYNLVWAALRQPRIVFARDMLVKALRDGCRMDSGGVIGLYADQNIS